MFNPNSNPNVFSDSLVSGDTVKSARKQGLSRLVLLPGTVVTPLAWDLARDYNIELHEASFQGEEPQSGPVALGCDHGGYDLKEILKSSLQDWDYQVLDFGCYSTNSVDYPDYAYKVALALTTSRAWRGIMLDGVGIGSTMMANKVQGVRCANCHNLFEIRNSRRHNNANMLCIGGQTLGVALAKDLVKTWLEEDFEGGRHAKRVNKINDLDWGRPPE